MTRAPSLPRLAQPRGLAARTAALLPRAPMQLSLLDALAAEAGPRAHVWASPGAAPVVVVPPPCHDCGAPCVPDRSRCSPCLAKAAQATAARRAVLPVLRPAPAPAPAALPSGPRRIGRPPAVPRPVWEGPLLLQGQAVGRDGVEQRERACPRVEQCEDDWIYAGREGQARCPAGCGVWAAEGGGE